MFAVKTKMLLEMQMSRNPTCRDKEVYIYSVLLCFIFFCDIQDQLMSFCTFTIFDITRLTHLTNGKKGVQAPGPLVSFSLYEFCLFFFSNLLLFNLTNISRFP